MNVNLRASDTHAVWMADGVVPLRRLDGSVDVAPKQFPPPPSSSSRYPTSSSSFAPTMMQTHYKGGRRVQKAAGGRQHWNFFPNAEDLSWHQIASILICIFVLSTVVCAPFILLGVGRNASAEGKMKPRIEQE